MEPTTMTCSQLTKKFEDLQVTLNAIQSNVDTLKTAMTNEIQALKKDLGLVQKIGYIALGAIVPLLGSSQTVTQLLKGLIGQ